MANKSSSTSSIIINDEVIIEDKKELTMDEAFGPIIHKKEDTKVELYESTESQRKYLELYGTKSNAIRELSKLNMSTGDISRALNIRYQHVRNVLNQKLKKS